MNWTFLPAWGIRGVVAVAAILLVAALVRMLRERGQAPAGRQIAPLVLRVAAVGLLVWAALNPTALLPRKEPGRPTLVVLVDTSGSMGVQDVDGQSRLAAARARLGDTVLASLEGAFEVDFRRFDATATPVTLEALSSAEGRASRIGEAVLAAVGDQAARPSQAGILLVTDGRETGSAVADAADLALARSVPVWTWTLGGTVLRRDLWLETPAAETLAFAGSEVTLSATLRQVGYPARSFALELLCDGEVLERLEALPGPDGSARVEAVVTAPDAGEHRYVFRVPPEPEEAETRNNERSVFLRVVGRKVRVLLAEGRPHWDTKFLVQALKRDPRVDLTAIYRLGPDRQFAVVSRAGEQRREEKDLFPRTAEGFRQFDILMFGRGCEAFFDADTEAHVTDFVARHGGGLVFTRGRPYGERFGPLAKLEPVVWSAGDEYGVQLVATAEAEGAPLFALGGSGDLESVAARLPALDRVNATMGAKPLGVVLARAETDDASASVVLAWHLYGLGRVATVNAGGLWRWAFREKGREEDETVYARFWSAMLRWMLSGSDFRGGADVALRSQRRLYTDEEPMAFLIRTRGLDPEAYRPKLLVRGPEGEATVEPRRERTGVYLAEAGPFAPGEYTVELQNNVGAPETLTMTVEVASASTENRILSADPEAMERLARISNGRVLSADELADLPGIVERWRAARRLAEEKRSLWDRWWIFAALLACLGGEWALRRREGLL